MASLLNMGKCRLFKRVRLCLRHCLLESWKKQPGEAAFADKEVLIQLQSPDIHRNTIFLHFKADIKCVSISAFREG